MSREEVGCDGAQTIDVRTNIGKPYSVERYYMLSEIEQKSLHPVYLNNYGGISDTNWDHDADFPAFIILYFLWNSIPHENKRDAADRFRRDTVGGAMRKLKHLWEKSRAKGGPKPHQDAPRVYVVVDMLVESSSSSDARDKDVLRREKFQEHIKIVEQFASAILLAEGAVHLDGVSTGIADHPRAAPGLESCLEAISFGSRDRRRHGSGSNNECKSCVGIVCNSLEDLVGFDEEGETDAVQDVIQYRTHAKIKETHRVGEVDRGETPLEEFAQEAHRYWRVHIAGLPAEPTPEEKKAYAQFDSNSNQSTMLWIIMLAIVLAFFPWKND